MSENPNPSDTFAALIEDAEFVSVELARGDAVPGDTLKVALPLIPPLGTALFACKANASPKPEDIVKLEGAMAALMAAIAPVSILSLRDTATLNCKRRGLFASLWFAIWGRTETPSENNSVADRFSNRFLLLTFIIFVLGVACTFAASPPPPKDPGWIISSTVAGGASLLAPFFYGAMGACVFLLRSLHKHIFTRTFDRRRIPEYYNRFWLGLISGGIIVLLVDPTALSSTSNEELKWKISASALGFLAGYNNDLLFSAIERITNAIFPKAADASTVGSPAPATTPGTASPP